VVRAEAGPRYHERLLSAGSTQEGALNGAFSRFYAVLVGRRDDLNFSQDVSPFAARLHRLRQWLSLQ
jgi:hypothetical protein